MSIIIRVLLSDFTIIIVLDVIISYIYWYRMRILQKWVGLIVCCSLFRVNPRSSLCPLYTDHEYNVLEFVRVRIFFFILQKYYKRK